MADAKSVLRALFPFISTAASMGGPLGTMAASALGNAIGAKVDPTKVNDMLMSADPATLEKARQAEQAFQVQMQQQGFQHIEDMEKIAADDRASARQREMTVRDRIPAVLSIGITLGFFGMLGAMLKWSPPASNKDLLNIMLGSLGTAWVAVVTYYFGSSAGADKKDLLQSQGKGN